MHIIANIPWAAPLILYLPLGGSSARSEAQKFKKISQNQYAERRARGTEPNDLFSHLIEGNKNGQYVKVKIQKIWLTRTV